MRNGFRFGLAALAMAAGVAATAQLATLPPREPPMPADRKPDYAPAASWLCRPDKADSACRVNLDATVVDNKGQRAAQRFTAAAVPKIDCFYVYPTVSMDPTMYSDMVPDEREREVIANQAARFAGVCRVFAPLYRQFTLPALRWAMAGHGMPDSPRNYEDVRAAWRWYMAHANKGRGVVLIGHSQGSFMLTRLLQEEIDGKPAQGRLVSALLAGNLDMTAARGSDRGGTFRAIPFCSREGQTGCVVAWSTYPAEAKGDRLFGNNDAAGHVGACVNPAAIAGGRGALKTYLPKPSFAAPNDPPFVEAVGQLTAECVADAAGSVLRVRAEPGPMQPLIERYLATGLRPNWGTHSRDINLVEGNLIDLVARQAAAWKPAG